MGKHGMTYLERVWFIGLGEWLVTNSREQV